jgi:hypothetical protein
MRIASAAAPASEIITTIEAPMRSEGLRRWDGRWLRRWRSHPYGRRLDLGAASWLRHPVRRCRLASPLVIASELLGPDLAELATIITLAERLDWASRTTGSGLDGRTELLCAGGHIDSLSNVGQGDDFLTRDTVACFCHEKGFRAIDAARYVTAHRRQRVRCAARSAVEL